MKQIIILLIATLFVIQTTQAQDSSQHIVAGSMDKSYKSPKPEKYSLEYYTIKSRKYNTSGWILLGVGSAMGIGGYMIYQNNLNKAYGLDHIDDAIMSSAGAELLMVAGSTMVIIGIPVLISSWHYKKMALQMSASLRMETGHEINQSGMINNHYPAIGLTIHL